MITNRALYDYAAKRLSYLQRRYPQVPMNHHDWDDWKQRTMIHIFAKKNLFRQSGSGHKAYIESIIKHQFWNHVRDNVKRPHDSLSRQSRLNVKYPSQIQTKIVQRGMLGDETIYEPDCPAPVDNISSESREQVTQIISLLTPETQAILSTYEKAASWDEAGRALKLNPQVARNRYRKAVALIRAQLASL